MNRLRLMLMVVAAGVVCLPVRAQDVWQMQESGTTAGLRGIDSVDGTVAWASGTGGTVLRTTDGGAHWMKCVVPDGDKDGAALDFRGVQAWDDKTAIVMASGPGDKSRLYRTKDGCGTWKLVFKNPDKDGFWDALSVADQKNMILFGDPVDGRFTLLATVDGGNQWDREMAGGIANYPKEGGFAASNSALLVDWADGPTAFVTGGPSGARIFFMCDACAAEKKWAVVNIRAFPNSQSAGAFALAKRNWKVFIAVGGDYAKPRESSGTAAWSANGGKSWNTSATPPHGYRSTVEWGESIHAWITAGTNGSDISRDDGKKWKSLDDGNWNALSLPFLVGPNGRIARLNPAAIADGK